MATSRLRRNSNCASTLKPKFRGRAKDILLTVGARDAIRKLDKIFKQNTAQFAGWAESHLRANPGLGSIHIAIMKSGQKYTFGQLLSIGNPPPNTICIRQHSAEIRPTRTYTRVGGTVHRCRTEIVNRKLYAAAMKPARGAFSKVLKFSSPT